jgi:hypothetical protein
VTHRRVGDLPWKIRADVIVSCRSRINSNHALATEAASFGLQCKAIGHRSIITALTPNSIG